MESGPPRGSGHPGPGAGGRGRGGAAIFNPMANRLPSCSVRRGAEERQPQSAGEGALERDPAPAPRSAVGAEGEPRGRRLGIPEPAGASSPTRAGSGGAPALGHQHWVFYPKSLGCEKGQLRGSQHKEQDLRFLKPLAFETAEGTSPDWVGVGLPVQIWTWTSGLNPNMRFALRC